IRLVEPPAPSHGALSPAELLLKLRRVFDDPAVERGVIHGDPPLAHHLLELSIRNHTNHIEQFNNTLRQRVSRLGRSTLAFSKSIENHIGAIRYFICHYNLTRAALLV